MNILAIVGSDTSIVTRIPYSVLGIPESASFVSDEGKLSALFYLEKMHTEQLC